MKKAIFAMSGVLACAVVALALMSAAAAPALVETEKSPALPETVIFPTAVQVSSISCQFKCADGTGFALDPCTDGSLGACCTNGGPACSSHGGMVDGICTQGRLGLPCVPL